MSKFKFLQVFNFLRYSIFTLIALLCLNFIPSNINTSFAEINKQSVNKSINSLRKVVAPDSRINLFDINVTVGKDTLKVSGKVMEQKQKDILMRVFNLFPNKISVNIEVFPFSDIGVNSYGIVSTSVLNMRESPKHSSQLVSQAILGMTMKIIEKKDNWLRVSIDNDSYIAWVQEANILRVNKSTYDAWNNQDKVMLTSINTELLKSPNLENKANLKLYMTTTLEYFSQEGNFYKVKIPKSKSFMSDYYYISKNSAKFIGKALSSENVKADDIINEAKKLISVPYLWGGNTSDMLDCSGFTQTVFRSKGYLLPRDADQQQLNSKSVGKIKDLKAGDLVFFSESVVATHVGIYIGQSQFIHCSAGYGKVTITSFDSKSPLYDPLYTKIFIGGARILK